MKNKQPKILHLKMHKVTDLIPTGINLLREAWIFENYMYFVCDEKGKCIVETAKAYKAKELKGKLIKIH